MNDRLIYISSCESTNKEAMKYLSLADRFGFAAVYTQNQTAGRGQGDHIWETTPGLNITMSFIVRFKDLKIQDHFSISQRIALACRHFIAKQLPAFKVYIKWPNDILVNEKKIAGILIENILEGEFITRSIIGVGLNVNQTEFGANLPKAISLKNCSNIKYPIEQLIPVFFNETESMFSDLDHQSSSEINQQYNESLYLRGCGADFEAGGTTFQAIVKEVGPDGRITVYKDGKFQSFYHHEGRMIL